MAHLKRLSEKSSKLRSPEPTGLRADPGTQVVVRDHSEVSSTIGIAAPKLSQQALSLCLVAVLVMTALALFFDDTNDFGFGNFPDCLFGK